MTAARSRVSTRTQLSDAVLSIGFAKSKTTIAAGLPLLEHFVTRARKCRLMGSAALDLAYVACGRLDAYIESSVSLWDVAAGQLLVEAAGGICAIAPRADHPDKLSVRASSGLLDLEATDFTALMTTSDIANTFFSVGWSFIFLSPLFRR